MTGIRRASSTLALAIGLAYAAPAFAQQPETQTTPPGAEGSQASLPIQSSQAGEAQEIVVTGSFIRGTPEDAALPVDVISADEIQKQGSPTLVDLIKSLPSSAGVVGDSNQFGAGQTTGSGTVNLRGLGSQRTLVLLNGRRMTPSPSALGSVDTNLLPSIAIGRIEVLKDGAAALYGSDAIAGVVNFITRTDLNGIEGVANYSFIDGSDGDYNVGINAGLRLGDRGNIFASAAYRVRSELSTRDREFALRDFFTNPQGGWSQFGSPGTYTTRGVLPGATAPSTTGVFADPGCNAISGPRVQGATAPFCAFSYSQFDNLVEDEEHYQFFASANYELTDTIELHLEGLYSGHNVERENSSPSYSPVQFLPAALNGGIAGSFFIPGSNPGLQALYNSYTPAELGLSAGVIGLSRASGVATTLLWRPIGASGNPLTGYEGKEDKRNFDAYRVSGGFKWDVNDALTVDANLTYMENGSDVATPDIVVSRLARALQGFGGFNCTGTTPGANGCLYFNPFSSGIPFNGADGRTNPRFNPNVPGALNSFEVIDYLYEDYAYQVKTKLLVFDFVLSGESGLDIGGGPIGFALGGQYRRDQVQREVADIANVAINPCVETELTGNRTCPGRVNGLLSFFGPLDEYDLSRDVGAAFLELQVPFTDDISLQAAVRYEDYGGNIGGTTNPKAALRWQVTDWLALRGSVSTTFRAPPLTATNPTATTGLSFTSAVGGYRAYDNFGNPFLQPETADTYNAGIILKSGIFNATLDYWRFDFSGPIDNEPGTDTVAALFPTGVSDAAACAAAASNPAFFNRFRFAEGQPCSRANLLRTNTFNVNSPDVRTSGLDLSFSARDDFLGGRLTAGLDGTYVIEYKAGDFVVEGVVVTPADDYAGKLDYQGYGSNPDIKGQAYAQFDLEKHSFRYTLRYVGSMEDTRGPTTFTAASPLGKKIADFATIDLNYTLNLEDIGLQLTASVQNLTDEDPSFARLDLNYDPFTGNPLGRVYKVGLRQKF